MTNNKNVTELAQHLADEMNTTGCEGPIGVLHVLDWLACAELTLAEDRDGDVPTAYALMLTDSIDGPIDQGIGGCDG